jgi:hypothetical protein
MRTAEGLRARIEETIGLLENGRIELPPGNDPIDFILSDGKSKPTTASRKSLGLSELYETYQSRLPAGSKKPTTLQGEAIHLKHLKQHLGPKRMVQAISKSDLQNYVASRLKKSYRGKPIRPDTVRKELVTFRFLWNWGVAEGFLTGPSPTKKVVLPLSDEKPPLTARECGESRRSRRAKCWTLAANHFVS